jgi:glycosyltransferase involved in cell wall biosynthesis
VPDEILVINNASTDETRAVAQQIPHVRVVDEPRKGLVVAREAGRRAATGDVLVYLDADCRAPLTWLERVESRFERTPDLIALSGPYRYYDWDWWGRLLIRAYDLTLAPATQLLVKYILRIGTIFYGGNFAVRADALEAIGGFDTSIEFHGEDTNTSPSISIRGRRWCAARRTGRRSAARCAATSTWRSRSSATAPGSQAADRAGGVLLEQSVG